MSQFSSSLCPCFCHPRLIIISWFSIGADSQRAAGSGDKKTARLFHSDATTWCVGRYPTVKYVAPLASSFTVPLAAFQQHYVTSRIHIWKRTRTHTHTPEAFSPTHACARWITLISRKTQQQTMSVLFKVDWMCQIVLRISSGLLQLAFLSLCCFCCVIFLGSNIISLLGALFLCCNYSYCILICHIDHVPVLYLLIIVCVS